MRSRVHARVRDVVCAVAVVAMVAHNFYHVRAARDLGADDEAWYVAGGVLAGRTGFPEGPNGLPMPELGPLHCLSYSPLSKIWTAPIDLYYAAWQIRITLLALAIFAVVRRARSPWWQGLLASFVFVNCAIADVWPFPVHTAALVVLTGIVAASFLRTQTAALGAMTMTFAFAGFCRPEMLYAYGVALLVLSIHVVRRRTGFRWLAAAIAPGIVLFAIFGNPLGGLRAYDAFGQHYTINLFAAQHDPRNPWTSWGETMAIDFPGARSPLQALRVNPHAFFAHVLRNVAKLPSSLLLATRPRLPTSKYVEYALWGIGCLVALVQARRFRVDRDVTRTALAFALGCAAVPFVLSILVVHPRLHYWVVVVILGITLVASCPVPAPEIGGVAPALALSALVVLLTATKNGTGAPPELAHVAAIEQLRALHLQGHVVSLEYAYGRCFYAGYDCEAYMRWDKRAPFDDFVAERHVDVVVFDDLMTRDARFVDDPEFKDFLVHPEAHGFRITDVPNSDIRIAVRR